MYNFDPEFNILEKKIHFKDQVLLFGSCFAQNMGDKLATNLVKVSSNPFGICFHPLPIANLIHRALFKQKFQASDFFYFDNYWWNYEHHGSLAQLDIDEYVDWSNQQLENLHEDLKSAKFIFLTFGTSFGYELINSDHLLVSNCHKQPQNNFKKVFISKEVLSNRWNGIIEELLKINPEITIICTVSPVRHFKDGLVQNSKSKSNLISFVHDLKERFESVKYFPIYELVVDVWRDHQYFNSDHIHLNENAIQSVFNIMKTSLFNEESNKMFEELAKIQSQLAHKPLHIEAFSHQSFLQKRKLKIELFEKKYKLKINL